MTLQNVGNIKTSGDKINKKLYSCFTVPQALPVQENISNSRLTKSVGLSE
jgi:hypothetical protein